VQDETGSHPFSILIIFPVHRKRVRDASKILTSSVDDNEEQFPIIEIYGKNYYTGKRVNHTLI